MVSATGWHDIDREDEWFRDAYREVAEVEQPGFVRSPLTIFARVKGAEEVAGDGV